MSKGKEGLGKLSAYTDTWIKQVFFDFYNLAIYAVSPKMNKIQNQGFQKLLKQEMKSENKKYISLVNYLTDLKLAILEIRKACEKGNKNQEWNMKCFDEYFDTYMELINFMSLKMFKYGVGFGIELKNKSAENFKW